MHEDKLWVDWKTAFGIFYSPFSMKKGSEHVAKERRFPPGFSRLGRSRAVQIEWITIAGFPPLRQRNEEE